MDLEQARTKWLRDRSQYRAFAQMLQERLNEITKELGIYALVSARTKETHSLIKKLMLKPHLSYETLPDKVGARIVVRFRSELAPIENCIRQQFAFAEVEDKSEKLGDNKLGYQSIHIDALALLAGDSRSGDFPPKKYFAELQIRTLSQHLWSEISHDAFYKNDDILDLSPDLRRRVNLTAGLVEIADREFDRMNIEAKPSPEIEIFQALAKLYYSFAAKRPDVDLSLEVIRFVLPLYRGLTPQEILQQHVIPTFEKNRRDIEAIYANPDSNYDEASAFFFQPEALLIYDRLQFDRDQLLAKWNEKFPENELARVATAFGISLQ